MLGVDGGFLSAGCGRVTESRPGRQAGHPPPTSIPESGLPEFPTCGLPEFPTRRLPEFPTHLHSLDVNTKRELGSCLWRHKTQPWGPGAPALPILTVVGRC